MSTQPKRIWSFSLRTLFVVTTILCLGLGWELSVIRQRQALRKEMEATQNYQFITAAAYSAMYAGTPPTPAVSISPLRRGLGDEAIHEIAYSYFSHRRSGTREARAGLSGGHDSRNPLRAVSSRLLPARHDGRDG